jgi:hypothetical protein
MSATRKSGREEVNNFPRPPASILPALRPSSYRFVSISNVNASQLLRQTTSIKFSLFLDVPKPRRVGSTSPETILAQTPKDDPSRDIYIGIFLGQKTKDQECFASHCFSRMD